MSHVCLFKIHSRNLPPGYVVSVLQGVKISDLSPSATSQPSFNSESLSALIQKDANILHCIF